MNNSNNKQGKVILIGAGPGDAGLLTLQGKHWLEKSDVVLFDHLVNEDLLRFTKKETEIIYVGKKEGVASSSRKKLMLCLSKKPAKEKLLYDSKAETLLFLVGGVKKFKRSINYKFPSSLFLVSHR